MSVHIIEPFEEVLILQALDVAGTVKDEFGFTSCVNWKGPKTFKSLRNVLSYVLLLDTGLRVGELVQLRFTDCYFQNQPVKTLSVRPEIAKRRSGREIPVSCRLAAALSRFCREPFLLEDFPLTQALISNRIMGHRLSTRTVERFITAAAENAVGRPVNPHMLRHTFGTKLQRKTDIRTVQELLGHKNLSSTQIYTHPDLNDKRQAINGLNESTPGA